MDQKTTTHEAPQFVKVIDQKVADYLISAGFSYMKEGNVYVFTETEELIAVLQRQFAEVPVIIENKLRF